MVPGFTAKAIKPTKTVGQRLKTARKRLELSLNEAERLTKVKLKYLEALEEDRHDLLPTEVYSLGFLRCYGESLGLNTSQLLEQYRHERQAVKTAKNQPTTLLAPARRLLNTRFLVTPKTLLTVGSLGLVIGLITYIVTGVHQFLAPPSLAINEPGSEARIEADRVSVIGQTEPAVTLLINGELVTVEPSGHFSREIALLPGLNTLELVATNRLGRATRALRKILADYSVTASPSPIPTSDPAAPTVQNGPLEASPSLSSSPSLKPKSTLTPTTNPSPATKE